MRITLSFGCLLISLIPENSILTKFRLPYIKEISILSYSLYLTHGFAINFAHKIAALIGLGDTLWPVWILVFPLSFMVAYMLYVFLEKPVLKMREKALLKNS